jgi:hypothetical protein
MSGNRSANDSVPSKVLMEAPVTQTEARLIVALLYVIAIEVAEINLRKQEFLWPFLGAFIAVSVSVIGIMFALKWA